jgi:outer membrane protein TolC
MNARANVVDQWRKIEFFANALKSDLDLVVDGQLATRPDNVLEFDADRSRIRLGVEYDSPITRLAERNRYRAALISYQRARRDYTLFEDRVSQSIRNTLRIIKISQINLEVRRVAVQVAIAQVDIARLRLNPPVRPDQPTRASPTAARDLVSALTDLLDAQNDLLNVWVGYEVQRVLLDFEMGTMQLDPTGVWIDPGPLEKQDTPSGVFEDQLELIEDPQRN